jgi:flagellar protein FlaG
MSSVNSPVTSVPVPKSPVAEGARVSVPKQSEAPKPQAPKIQAPPPEAAAKSVSDAAKLAATTKADVDVEQYARQTKAVMERAAQQIQGYLQESGRELNVTVDESTGYYVARVTNPQTGEVVRTLPSEETLRIARNIDQMRGMLVNQRA